MPGPVPLTNTLARVNTLERTSSREFCLSSTMEETTRNHKEILRKSKEEQGKATSPYLFWYGSSVSSLIPRSLVGRGRGFACYQGGAMKLPSLTKHLTTSPAVKDEGFAHFSVALDCQACNLLRAQ